MHTPDTAPRPSIVYDYQVFPFRRPPELDGARNERAIVVGAGPIGMLVALGLARFGVASIILEQDVQVTHGSRAAVLTRRSMEILRQNGLDGPFVAKGLPWRRGRSFFRGREVYQMEIPHDPDSRFMPLTNVPQQYIEEYLVRAIERNPLIDLRWGSKVVDLTQDATRARLTVDTPSGPYALEAPWVVAADGGRSGLRKALGLRMEGRSYAGNFVIADIKADLPLPTERLCYFDPDWNRNNNVLVHRLADGVWRVDYRLPDDEQPEQALAPDLLARRIDLTLAMVGHPVPWTLDWATVYSANTLTLPGYLHGRVAFAGDAAHLLPIFGVRGANTGFQDADNLAWKLAFVIKGWAGRALLDSYSSERVEAAWEICEEAGKSTRFMTPPSRGFRLMRDAALSFSLSEDFTKDLMHWRTSRPHVYATSPLNGGWESALPDASGPARGEPAPDVKLADDDHLLDHVGPGFTLLHFSSGDGPDIAVGALPMAPADLPLRLLTVRARQALTKYGAVDGTTYLVRPDGHLAARWRRLEGRQIEATLGRMLTVSEAAS